MRFVYKLVVLLASASLAGCSNPHEPKSTSEFAGKIFGGEDGLGIVANASTVTARRMHPRDGERSGSTLEDYDLDEPVEVAAEGASELRRLLTQPSSYLWGAAKACIPDYGVLLTFQTDAGEVRVALCFKCRTLGVFRGDDNAAECVNHEEDFDTIFAPVLKIVQETFPTDDEIQSLSTKRR